MTGIPANTADSTVYDARVAAFQSDRPANAAYDLENTLIATHATLLGQITDVDIADVIASVVSMESHQPLPGRALGPRRQLRCPVHTVPALRSCGRWCRERADPS